MVHIHEDFVIDYNQLVLKEKIGVGAYGEVYRAKWGNEDVAVKKVLIGGAKEEHLRQIEYELHKLLTTRHPRMLNYYGVCVKSVDEIWIVMEYADGGNLSSFLAKSKHTTWTIKWKWIVDIVIALDFLHKKKILHNALKSYNFLIVKGELKISDFGMTATAQLQAGRSLTHKDDAPKGTARWLAPELTSSNPAYSEKSDIFSLGMILWEISEAAIPFADEKDDMKLIEMIKYQKLRPSFTHDAPKELQRVTHYCWDEAPQKRPTSTEILNELQSRLVLNSSGVDSANKQRAFFEIHYNELLGAVQKDDIRTLNNPPKYPGEDPAPMLPPEIIIIHLHPPPPQMLLLGVNSLVSQKYNIRLFGRVLEYFNRFYVPSNPNEEAIVEGVDVIWNKYLDERFAQANEAFEYKYNGLVELRGDNQNDLQQKYLEHLLISKNLVANNKSNPISAFHGVNEENLESIYWYGLLNLSTTDPGYYGKGIYLTQKPSYGEYYARARKDGEKHFSLLLCWVLLGRPYAMTKVKVGSPLTAEHSSHYVVVTRKQLTPDVCSSTEDYIKLRGVSTFFPVVGDEPAQGDEIVVFHPDQVLPRYVIHYKVGPKTPATKPTFPTFTPKAQNSPKNARVGTKKNNR